MLIDALEPRRLLASVPSGFTETQLASGLASPTALTVAPDGRVFVALQNGTIRVIKNDQMLSTPLVQLPADSGGERGLLGITVDPNFASNRFIYVYYTAANPTSHNRISRLTLSGDTVVAGSEVPLLDLPSIGSAIWHMGGALHFGPDGKIYAGVGDHQNTSTPQSLSSPFGKILRINPDGSIPTDNPFYNSTSGVNRAIWALGLRNPYTAAFQPGTGRFFINDVGEAAWEEIDEGSSGANYGWPATEGQTSNPAYVTPFYAYPHGPECAVTGGAFYNPATVTFPSQYLGKYLFADFCGGWIRTIDPVSKAVGNFASGISFPTDLRVAPSGALYYLARGDFTGGQPSTGQVFKIQYTATAAPSITSQPSPQTVALGEPVTFSVTAAGPGPLSYQWQRNGVDIPGANSASYSIASTVLADNGAQFRLRVSNSGGSTTSNAALLTVVNGTRPTASLTAPSPMLLYRGGDTIEYAATATDAEDGTLPPSAYTWRIDFHHHDHTHPFLPPTSGSSSGSFLIPTTGEKEDNVFYRILLTVTDSTGLTFNAFRDVLPQKADITLQTNVPGLSLILDGQPRSLPLTVSGVVGITRTLSAPPQQTIGGTTYVFGSWSDGGAATHDISFPAVNTTYTATYVQAPTVYVSDLNPTSATNGWGTYERDRSNGETGPSDGRTITLNGVTFAKGLGVHANSDLRYNLGGEYSSFQSQIGIDDEVGNAGSVIFQVYADGVLLYDSGAMSGSSATKTLNVDVSGRTQLRLLVGTNGEPNYDHADWADAKLIRADVQPPPPPPPNVAPVAGDDSATTISGTPVQINVLANDSDSDGTLVPSSVTITNFPTSGSVSVDSTTGRITYTPAGTFTGTDTFFYTVRDDGGATSNAARATVTVNAAPPPPPPPPPGDIVYLSDLTHASTTNGWGPYERDRSNGEMGASDGRTITLNGVTYTKGLGVHANSDLYYSLGGQYTSFQSHIGIDDEVGSAGSVIFQVFADGVLLYDSGAMTGSSATKTVNVDVSGRNELRLFVGTNGEPNYDHADWADARLTIGTPTPDTQPPTTPANLRATGVTSNTVSLAWDASIDNIGVAGYGVYRNGVKVGTTSNLSFTDTGLAASTTYSYTVLAFDAAQNASPQSAPISVTTAAVSPFVYLSDLNPTFAANGWGPYERDRSNGETGASDGRTITLNGVTYAKGLGVHANSDLRYNLGGQYSTFQAHIGIDDEVGSGGSVIFQVWASGVLLYDSGAMTGSSATRILDLNISGINELRLVVLTNGEPNYDHADWADAKVS